MTTESNWLGKLPEPPSKVLVEYDSDGKRETKEFGNLYEARSFFARKLKEGKSPKVKKWS